MVIELKWNQGAMEAIEQTKDRNYPEIFEGYEAIFYWWESAMIRKRRSMRV